MGADTKANTLGAAAHLRLVISVLLRTAASAVTPVTLMTLLSRLRARDRMGNSERAGMSMGADTKGKLWGGSAPQVSDLRLVEDGSERRGAPVSDVVVPDTAKHG